MSEEQHEYLTIPKAAKRLGQSDEWLRRQVKAGMIPSFRRGTNRRWRFVRVADLDNLFRRAGDGAA